MESFWRDLKHAFRSLRRAPSYTFAAIAALALAIGANTALFSLIEATLLRPYPYPQPEQLLIVRESSKQFPDSSVSLPNFRDWRAQARDVFNGMAAFRRDSFNLTGSGEPERVGGRMVASDFFGLLGVQPQLGRTFSEQDDAAGAARTAVISNTLWQRRFGSDPRVVGQTITLTGNSYTVIGVLPPGFRFLTAQDVFVPIGLWSDQYKNRDDHPGISVVARMKSGVRIEQALAALNAVAVRLEKEYPRSNTGQRVRAKTIQDDQTEDFRTALFVLWGAVGLVLLIAAANVANLALARSAARAPELALRSALGAGRGRLMRELLTESVLLAVVGGAAGILLAIWGLDALLPWVPEVLRRNAEVRLDGTVLVFTAALSLVTGLAFGVLPALRASEPDLDALLRDSHATDSRPRRRLRSALVVGEIALSLMLLIGAGLLLRSFASLTKVDLGFQAHGLVALQVTLPQTRYPDGGSIVRFEELLRERIGVLPGVRAVAVTQSLPLFDDNSTNGFWVEGRPRPAPGEGTNAYQYTASPGFLASMGARLLRGRELRDDDTIQKPALLIDDALAKRLFGEQDPIGQHLMFPQDAYGPIPPIEIVGIYHHMQQNGPGDVPVIDSGMVLPFQIGAMYAAQWFHGFTVLARAEGDLAQAVAGARREVAALDPELPVYNVKTMDTAVDEWLASRRFSMLLLSLFAAVALLLAAVGVYGVTSYGVVQRTREIGIRMALGARQADVLRLVVTGGARLAGLGIGIGVVLAFGLSRVLRGMLYGVNAADPLTYLGLALMLALVAIFASWLPARRAARVDPNVALRAE